MRGDERLLMQGGVFALESASPCQLTHVQPTAALQDMAWKDALVVRAASAGSAQLACGSQRTRLLIVKPARLELVLVEAHVQVGQRFHVRAVPRDHEGRELEVGKWTEVAWHSSGSVTLATDPSAGEFGMCTTCFGVHGFEAAKAGPATIEAHVDGAMGTLQVMAQP